MGVVFVGVFHSFVGVFSGLALCWGFCLSFTSF